MLQPNERKISDLRRNSILSSIVTAVSKEPLSIAQVARKFSLNRSTTRYYLGLLKEQRMIKFERQEHTPGRPTLIMIDEEAAKEYWENTQKRVREYSEKMKKDQVTLAVLEYLKQNKKATTEEVLEFIRDEKIDDMYASRVLSSLQYLKTHKKIVDEWRML